MGRGRGQRTKAEWIRMDEDRGRDIFIHINYSAIRWMKIRLERPRLQPDAQTDPRGMGPEWRERKRKRKAPLVIDNEAWTGRFFD